MRDLLSGMIAELLKLLELALLVSVQSRKRQSVLSHIMDIKEPFRTKLLVLRSLYVTALFDLSQETDYLRYDVTLAGAS